MHNIINTLDTVISLKNVFIYNKKNKKNKNMIFYHLFKSLVYDRHPPTTLKAFKEK